MFSFDSASMSDFKRPKNLSIFPTESNFASYPSMNCATTNTTALLTPTSPTYTPTSFRTNDFNDAFDKTADVPISYTFPSESEFADFYSFVETPNSIQSATPSNIRDDIFKFEPEHIEQFHQTCYAFDEAPAIVDFDTEYMNYDEDNCQSKNNSHCSSPDMDPWMCLNLRTESASKPANVAAGAAVIGEQVLPSMDSAFGNQFANGCIVVNRFDTPTALDFAASAENFNSTADIKPNREQKDLWTDRSKPLNVVEDVSSVTDLLPTIKDEPGIADVLQLQCLWKDCFIEFGNQAQLVEHIEKRHVETRKGEEFSCYWHECGRRQKPFNARYKLLIHMRVHSGEKPNKCQVINVIINLLLSAIDCITR